MDRERLRYEKQQRASDEREYRRQNETVRTLSEAFVQGAPPTLDDLLCSAERDWSLRSSQVPSAPAQPSDDDEFDDQTERTRDLSVRPLPPPHPRRR